MSRTDRHKPYRVKVADPYEQRFYWHDQGGKWGWRKVFTFRDCNCRWCGMHFVRKAENRKRRHVDQHLGRQALKGETQAWDGRMR